MIFTISTVVLGAALAAFASPAPVFEKRQALAQVITECTKPNTTAITFDDGPWVDNKSIVDQLTAAGAVGTFFFNGDNYGCIYDDDSIERIKYAYEKGHMVASHTWRHLDLTKQTWDKIHDEMWRVEQALQRITGAYPAFMRPPFGNYNNLVRQASAVRGQKLVIWDLDTEDSIGATAAESKAAYDKAIAEAPGTLLVLNHETVHTTATEVLPYALEKLKAAGYELVSVADCLGLPPYQSVQEPEVKNATWKC